MPVVNYLWDEVEDNVIAEYDDEGNTLARYTTVPYRYGDLISQNRSGEKSYYHFDGQGSTRALTDENENVTDTYAYTAFGEEVAKTGTTENPFRYVGEKGYYFDTETDEYYVRRRLYGPAVGRWTSVDPLDFLDGMNLYQFVTNGPIAILDYSGLIGIKTTKFSTNRCGKFRWDIDWTAGDVTESGFIVQFMDVYTGACGCKADMNEHGCFDCDWNFAGDVPKNCKEEERHYTEVWYVRHDAKMNTVYDQFCRRGNGKNYHHAGAADIWCWNGPIPPFNRDTCGYVEYWGKAFFVSEKDFPATKYKFAGEKYAGCLLSLSSQDLALLAKAKNGTVDRFLHSLWSCCGPENVQRDKCRGIYNACCWTHLDAFSSGVVGQLENLPSDGAYEDFQCFSEGASYGCPQSFDPKTHCNECLGRPIDLPS